MDITNVIDRLDALLNTSRKMPGTHSRLVDADKVMELVEQLRLAVPQDVKSAQEVIAKKDSILGQAQIDARRTKAQAETEYASRLDQNEVVAAARRKAQGLAEEAEHKSNKLTEQAESDARRTRMEVDAYAVQTLRDLDRELTAVITTVRKGLDTLGATMKV